VAWREHQANVSCVFSIIEKGTADGEWDIIVQGEKIPSVKSIKLLDMPLKSNLVSEDEINGIIRKCEPPIKIMNCVKHTWCGADPLILMRLCKVVMSSRIEYGAFYPINLRINNYRI
jgi:hypothetical protein